MHLLMVFISTLIFSHVLSQESSDSGFAFSYLKREIDQYCDLRCNQPATVNNQGTPTHPRIGKAGPIGPRGSPGTPGKPGSVNYTIVEELIDRRMRGLPLVLPHSHPPQNDCASVDQEDAKTWNGTGGIFIIYPGNSGRRLEVYCDLTTDQGGWTVFQRRMDGSENFNREWVDYVNGFGKTDREFWLGLDKIHSLTSSGKYELRVDLEDWEGNKVFAHYSEFSVASSSLKYKLSVGGFSGTVGDSLSYHSGNKFSTPNQDNDAYPGGNCAEGNGGGWWFNACDHSNLNGNYHIGAFTGPENGVEWQDFKNTGLYSMKFTEMKFRPKL